MRRGIGQPPRMQDGGKAPGEPRGATGAVRLTKHPVGVRRRVSSSIDKEPVRVGNDVDVAQPKSSQENTKTRQQSTAEGT